MARFFFDFQDGGRHTSDQEGLDLEDMSCAKREAMIALVQVLQLEQTEDDRHHIECRVRDGSGNEVYRVSLSYDGKWASEEKQVRNFEQFRRELKRTL